MRTRDELGDAMRRLVAQANEVASQRGVKSEIRFAPGPATPEEAQEIQALNTSQRRFEGGLIEWGSQQYDVCILAGELKLADDVVVIYCDIPGGDEVFFRKLAFRRIATLLETAGAGIGIECDKDCFVAVSAELVLDGASGQALFNTLLHLGEAAQAVGLLLQRWDDERRRKQRE